MYSVGNIVIYTLYGICTITEETERFFNGVNTKYFVLVPLSDTKTKITVPAENPITLSRIHSLLASNEIEAIIEEIPFLETIWIENDNQRIESEKSDDSGRVSVTTRSHKGSNHDDWNR